MGKAFLGVYRGRTNQYFGQPMHVELFGIPATMNVEAVHPNLSTARLSPADETGRSVPFELVARGSSGGGTGEFVHLRPLPTRTHSADGYWKPGTYALTATVGV